MYSLNPKSQALNPNPTGIALPIPIKEGAKQYLNFNFPNPKLIKFKTLEFRIWNLFRV